jgi:uncharacterized protein
MPEYLAPGVYVEEVSFRSRSIEGVSTSTTGFVGPTRRGPVGDVPELITSFPDFERVYGGLDNLTHGLNYMAHAVRAYFDEGGARLYVSRVFLPASDDASGRASSSNLVDGPTPAEQARLVARFPGEALNGRIELRQIAAPATRRTMESAVEGTLLRVGGTAPALPARLDGSGPTFSVRDGGRLLLTVNGADAEITFRGEPAEVFGESALSDPISLDDSNNTLIIVVGSAEQAIPVPADDYTPEALVQEINRRMRGGYARLSDGDDAGEEGRLVIGSDRAGSSASITVRANDAFGIPDEATTTNAAGTDNNVADLSRVTAEEIDDLLEAASIEVRAGLSTNNHLVLTTTATGASAALAVRSGDDSVHAAFGLAADEPAATGQDGDELSYYVKRGTDWRDRTDGALDLSGVQAGDAPRGGAEFLTLNIVAQDRGGSENLFDELGFDRDHPRWVGAVLAETPGRRAEFLENMYALRVGSGVSGFELRDGLFPTGDERAITLSGGDDGAEPTAAAYGAALAPFNSLDDISIVAAPGHGALTDFQGIQLALISHAERRRAYRIAVLETPPQQTPGEARTVRSRIDSRHAALYYPWVVISNPLARPGVDTIPREISVPPSGFICGIFARNDVERGVHKAPANEVVRGALRFETEINFAQQEMLNPIGVNCLRFFPGRGFRVWGARTVSSDPEWKYVNVRRYFNYVERSVDNGTQWAVFEANGERLWANVRETVESFLYNEWRSGALLGGSPKEAFFVRCDRSTMTQSDLDNGRLICLVGVAVLKPAEFVIFRIGQKTADARS